MPTEIRTDPLTDVEKDVPPTPYCCCGCFFVVPLAAATSGVAFGYPPAAAATSISALLPVAVTARSHFDAVEHAVIFVVSSTLLLTAYLLGAPSKDDFRTRHG